MIRNGCLNLGMGDTKVTMVACQKTFTLTLTFSNIYRIHKTLLWCKVTSQVAGVFEVHFVRSDLFMSEICMSAVARKRGIHCGCEHGGQ